MRKSTILKVVTSNVDYVWRSDLSKVEIINEKAFIEHTEDGFLMKNKNIMGIWAGAFGQMKENETRIVFMGEL